MRYLYYCLVAIYLACTTADARDVREFQYVPDNSGAFVSENGSNLYTRAIYGPHSLWRLETSDRPIFGVYHKKDNRNINFSITTAGTTIRLDSTAYCRSEYRCGTRHYLISDPLFGDGTLTITATASQDIEKAYFKIESRDMPRDARITVQCCPTTDIKLNRSGDLGADPDGAFNPQMQDTRRQQTDHLCTIDIPAGGNKDTYIIYNERKIGTQHQRRLRKEFDKAISDAENLGERIKIQTPDPLLNTLGSTLSYAGDAIWDGETFLHGAIGWRMPLAGWRGAYTGDFLGWHDRARSHFNAYAVSQVKDVPPIFPHPTQDAAQNLARAEKKWGTQMYSNGYICRNPHRHDQMHHYDMDLCYIDELLWHLQWTGDTAYAREVWPVLKSALAWEKRNYDPDGDGLYDAYCCIWASDALFYSGGGVTHSSALNHRANKLAARVAELAGDDPRPYLQEAAKIREAMDSVLFMPDEGVWAEYKDLMGEQRLHTHPALWTIYHAIDGDAATDKQAYSATRYIDRNIPHIPVETRMTDGTGYPGYYTLSTTDWMPYAWSINNVAFAEVYNTALAYWQANRPDEATKILKGAVLDGMYLGQSPANIGQISHYDAARGECYRDFADPVGVLSRAVVQGLFGFNPRLLFRTATIRPGFPLQWDEASIEHPDFSLSYHNIYSAPNSTTPNSYSKRKDRYNIKISDSMKQHIDSVEFILPMRFTKISVQSLPSTRETKVRIENEGTPYATAHFTIEPTDTGIMVSWEGEKTDNGTEDMPPRTAPDLSEAAIAPLYNAEDTIECRPVDLSAQYNANVTDIFRNRYLSPRPPFTTLQLPVQGIGEWCHPKDSAAIDDTALRRGNLKTPEGVKFDMPTEGHNIVFASLFDNYPDSVTIPLDGSADGISLLMAGSTNHMQCYITNASVTVKYADGTEQTTDLVPPYNWAPIEQDYYTDGMAFAIPEPRMQRVAMKTGETDTHLGEALGIDGVYGRRIDGGAANILHIPLDKDKTLSNITLHIRSNDVVIGILAATLTSLIMN